MILKILILFTFLTIHAEEKNDIYKKYYNYSAKELIFEFGVPDNHITLGTSTYYTYKYQKQRITYRLRNDQVVNVYLSFN